MKKYISLKTEATIRVPSNCWANLRQALARQHNERVKAYGEMFVTDTRKCNLGELSAFCTQRKAKTFMRQIIFEMPVSFQGDIVFVCQD